MIADVVVKDSVDTYPLDTNDAIVMFDVVRFAATMPLMPLVSEASNTRKFVDNAALPFIGTH